MKYKPEQRNILSLETSHYNSKKIVGNCEVCDSDNKATEVHHLQYQKNAKKDNDYIETFHKNHLANLINICEECHQKIHKTNTQHKIRRSCIWYIFCHYYISSRVKRSRSYCW